MYYIYATMFKIRVLGENDPMLIQSHNIASIFTFEILVFEKKRNCKFAGLRLNGLLRKVVVVSKLQ